MYRYALSLLVIFLLTGAGSKGFAQEYLPGLEWPEPAVVDPGESNSDAPSDAVVLFDGGDLSAFRNTNSWKVEDGVMIAGKDDVITRQEFGDCQLHIEWSAPNPPQGSGQKRGNSGVFFVPPGVEGGYELQVLDSYHSQTYFDGQAGAIYKQTPPMVNVMRPPGEWNTYDILWTWPRFNADGTLKQPATITALQNGVVIQNHFELLGDTPYNRPPRYKAHPPQGSIMLQDHKNPVRFRNIWVREQHRLMPVKVNEPQVRWGDKRFPYKPDDELRATAP